MTDQELRQKVEGLVSELLSLLELSRLAPEPLCSTLDKQVHAVLESLLAYQKAQLRFLEEHFGNIRMEVSYLDFDLFATKQEMSDLKKRLE